MGRNVIYLLLFILLTGNGPAHSQNFTIDSLLMSLEKDVRDTNRVITLNTLSRKYINEGVYENSFKYASDALRLSVKLNYLRGKANAYNNLGITCWYDNDYTCALLNYEASLQLMKQIGDQNAIAWAYNNLGLVYNIQGNYPEALQHHIAALRIREKLGNDELIANSHINIGAIYRYQQLFEEAKIQHQIALALMESIGDSTGVAIILGNIGAIHHEERNYTEALSNYTESLRLYRGMVQTHEVRKSIADLHQSLGLVYYYMSDNQAALNKYLASLSTYEELDNTQRISMACNNIADLYLTMKQYAKGLVVLKRGMTLAINNGDKVNLKFAYRILSRMDSVMGDHKSSFENYKLYIAYRDSLVNDENIKKQTQLQLNYEFDKQHAADSISNAENLTRENLKHEQEIQQQKLLTYGGVIGFSLMIIVAGVSFRAYRQKRKANGIISLQKLLVEAKQKEILDSIHYAKRIQQSLLPSEKYIDRILSLK